MNDKKDTCNRSLAEGLEILLAQILREDAATPGHLHGSTEKAIGSAQSDHN